MQQKRPHLQHLLFADEAEQQTFVNLRFMFVGGDEGDKANFTVSASSHWVTLEPFGMSAFSSVSMITGRGCFSESVNIQRAESSLTSPSTEFHWTWVIQHGGSSTGGRGTGVWTASLTHWCWSMSSRTGVTAADAQSRFITSRWRTREFPSVYRLKWQFQKETAFELGSSFSSLFRVWHSLWKAETRLPPGNGLDILVSGWMNTRQEHVIFTGDWASFHFWSILLRKGVIVHDIQS